MGSLSYLFLFFFFFFGLAAAPLTAAVCLAAGVSVAVFLVGFAAALGFFPDALALALTVAVAGFFSAGFFLAPAFVFGGAFLAGRNSAKSLSLKSASRDGSDVSIYSPTAPAMYERTLA